MEHTVEMQKKSAGKRPSSHGERGFEGSVPLHPMLALQQQAGNQAMQQLLRAGAIRAKLEVSQPGDAEEQEADAVADRIMRSHAGAGVVASSCSCSEDETSCGCLGSGNAKVSRSASAGTARVQSTPSAHGVLNAMRSSAGHPLDSHSRSFFEPKFGRDLSSVRIHTDSTAAGSARAIDAHAFTTGSDIFFSSGKYVPGTESGMRLLAHELTHVAQQDGNADRVLHRQPPPTANTATPPNYAPADSMRSNIEELDMTALPNFQQAIDAIDEKGIGAAGEQVKQVWQRIEGNFDDVTAEVCTEPSIENPSGEGKPADVQADFNDARSRVLKSVGTQTFHTQPVLGKISVPNFAGTLLPFIESQKNTAAWVAKDTNALIALLKQEKLSEDDQWKAVGLLRQHLNPWNFAYMRAAVQEAGLESKFRSFAKGPAQGYQSLTETTAQIVLLGEVSPSDDVGLLALLPAAGKVRLLQPMSPSEVSAEIYGKPDLWQTLLVPFNPAELSDKGAKDWLLMGTELRVEPDMLVPQYASLFAAAKQAQQMQSSQQGRPYLEASGNSTAVVGNTINYSIHWPLGIWPDIYLKWWLEYDPYAVSQGIVAETEQGPLGIFSASGPSASHDISYAFAPSVTGTHTVHCTLTYGNTVEDLSYAQTVITLEQKTNIEQSRGFDYKVNSPKDILNQLHKELDDLPATPANEQQRADLNKRIGDIEQSLKDAKSSLSYSSIPATYISASEQPLRLPLRLFVGYDPDYNEADRGYNLKLWDYTLQGQPFTVTAQGERVMGTLEALLRTFADKCYYPKGNILAQISPIRLAYFGIYDESLTLATSGPKLIDEIMRLLPPDVLRALSMGSLGLAVVTGLAGQEEAAIPLFEVSVYLSGAAASEELVEKLQHGQFKWDAGTVMQLADVASALIGLGGRFSMITSVQGVGRVSIMPAMAGIGKGIGVAQIGIIAGVHASEIVAAVQSKDKDKVISALLRALGDAAFFFIVHKAAAGAGKGRAIEGEPEFIEHQKLKAVNADEVVAGDHHDLVITEDGRVFRCSDECADLRWLFEHLLDERPETFKELQAIARKPRTQRPALARALYEKLQGLQNIRNLSNAELADRIAKGKGTKFETDLKLERLRRQGVELSSEDILESPEIQARKPMGGKVPDPFEVGNFAHAMFEKLDGMIGGVRITSEDLPPGCIKEFTIPDMRLPFEKRPRIDRLFRSGETIYEIKPASQKVRGDAQARGYVELMNRFEPLPEGRKWQYKTVTYDEARVKQFLIDKGVL